MIHARAAREGGPFHTMLCPGCQVRLVAERTGQALLFATEDALPHGSRVLKMLRAFIGMPSRPGGAGNVTDSKTNPRLDRPRPAGPRAARPGPRRPDRPATPPQQAGPGVRFRRELQVLGLGVDCAFADVKSRFRSLAKQLHPDRVTRLSASDQASAKERFLAAKSAYETICAGWDRS